MRTYFHRLASVPVLILSLVACGTGTGSSPTTDLTITAPPTTAPPTTAVPATTTTTTATTSTVSDRLPEAAITTRTAIRNAALADDYQRLAEIALGGRSDFTASFGQDFSDPAELAAYWEGLVADGEPLSEILVALTRLDVYPTSAQAAEGEQVEMYVSPRAMHTEDPADLAALEAALGPERVASWFADGMYLGWRMGIDSNGDWRFFVFGD